MDTPDSSPVLRIGELSKRVGVSDHVLRAWEGRYGLLQPVRSAGGFRLYSEADALRVRRMEDPPLLADTEALDASLPIADYPCADVGALDASEQPVHPGAI